MENGTFLNPLKGSVSSCCSNSESNLSRQHPTFLSKNNSVPFTPPLPSKIHEIVDCIASKDVLDTIDVILFDCDGVLWHGDMLLPKVEESLVKLSEMNKKLFFVTNDSTKSRSTLLEKMRNFGFGENIIKNKEFILSSSFAAAEYLKSKNFHLSNQLAYVIGEKGISEELQIAGIPSIGGIEDSGKVVELKRRACVDIDKRVGAVIVGLDRNINYFKLQYAQVCINQLKAEFIATNMDSLTNSTDAQEWVGGGSMVSAIYGCTQINPVLVGKPSVNLFEILEKKFGISRDRTIMIGDNLNSDISFAKNCGMKSVLTLTGITKLEHILTNGSSIQPDYFIRDLSDLV